MNEDGFVVLCSNCDDIDEGISFGIFCFYLISVLVDEHFIAAL